MHLEEAIKTYDNCLHLNAMSSLLKWINKLSFQEGTVGQQELIKEVRDVQVFPLASDENESQTRRHWFNLIGSIIMRQVSIYKKECSGDEFLAVNGINALDILKYVNSGHYKAHVDHAPDTPRTLSCVLLLNDDYEGGQLQFAHPYKQEIIKSIDVKPGRLIIWPSNFLYPHGVTPVTNGIRYSMVSWLF